MLLFEQKAIHNYLFDLLLLQSDFLFSIKSILKLLNEKKKHFTFLPDGIYN